MVPPKRTNFNMVSRTHFCIFYLPFAFRPPTSESDLLENVDIVIFAMDISYTPSPSKISSRSSKLSISMHHFSSRLWLWNIFAQYIAQLYLINPSLCKSSALSQISRNIYVPPKRNQPPFSTLI